MDQFAIVLAGIIAPLLIGALKRAEIKGAGAAWASFIICLMLSGGLVFLRGDMDLATNDPVKFFEELGPTLAAVFATATLMYNTFKNKLPGFEGSTVLELRKLDRLAK